MIKIGSRKNNFTIISINLDNDIIDMIELMIEKHGIVNRSKYIQHCVLQDVSVFTWNKINKELMEDMNIEY